ncbi:hypothetical protein niasHS_011345 [Heterodera schachtii]|uniref:RING-type domain-containing protein n=1 Tax=Heterodera schachtii TaxID=97005 RepID=A0ABD2I784_HETSC
MKEYLQFVIQMLALRLRISPKEIVPQKKMSKERIFIEFLKVFIQEKKANKKAKIRQSVDKKGQKIKRDKGEKVTDKAKANLQRMLQLLGTAIDQIDGKEHLSGVGFLGNQKRRTKRCLIDLMKNILFLIGWIIDLIIAVVIIAVAAPFVVVGVVLDGVVKGSVAAVNSVRHLHNSGPIVPPAGPVPKERAIIINKVTQRIVQEGEPSAECAICLGNYELDQSVDKLPCEGKHEFHTSCIQLWFKQNSTCPLCRTKISVVPAE